jgi:pyrimidine operon attenuation protein/uracil phosphoribosyltransferase
MSRRIMTQDAMHQTYERFAMQILENYDSAPYPALIGMQSRGVFLAKRIQAAAKKASGMDLDFGVLDITFYRDDFRTKLKMPEVKVTDIPFDLYDRDIVLVDDVLFTGRTVRSAMSAILDYGRPRSIKFCCMVDRGHRELPIAPDFVGVVVPTKENEEVRVRVLEMDGEDAVDVVEMTNDGGEV